QKDNLDEIFNNKIKIFTTEQQVSENIRSNEIKLSELYFGDKLAAENQNPPE
ncbi:TPA: hypothetical protein P1K35_003238, partial [Providencia rettgeri]